MSAPITTTTSTSVGNTIGGFTVTELQTGLFHTNFVGTIPSTHNSIPIPDDSYTYVGDLNGNGTSSGNALNYPVYYSNVTGKYFVPGVDTAPSPGLGVQFISQAGAPLYTTGLTNGENSSFNYSTGVETVTPCFCPGTLIGVPSGQAPVEQLAIGDAIVTATGGRRRVKWIGRRSYFARFVAGRRDLLPVCIKAGALDGTLPLRDLFVSPLHAMLLDGVLVAASLLVNGKSVVQGPATGDVHYVHIELDSPDALLAEGAAAESFINDDSRGIFQNADEYAALYPGEAVVPARFHAPRVESGYQFEAIRQRIDALAGVATQAILHGALHGALDGASAQRVHGWAQDQAHPDAPVCLDVLVDGQQVAQVLANAFRADLLAAGIGDGQHGFDIRLPQGGAGTAGTVEVRRSSDGAMLGAAASLLAA